MKSQASLDKVLNKDFPLTPRELVEALPRFRATSANQDFLSERERLLREEGKSPEDSAVLDARLKIGDVVAMLARSYWAVMDLDDEIAESEGITERLNKAIAKEESISRLLEAQRELIKQLVGDAEKSGELIGPGEAAKALGVPARSLREYARKRKIPCFQFGKHRKYDLAEVKRAAKEANEEARSGSVADARRSVLR